ncbi:MAG: hypothetical protein FWH23_06185 [Bacteroidales bacterium]|nr:hypothetical protein [Bacteroidales bacterium]
MFVLSKFKNFTQVFKPLPLCLLFLLMVFSCNKEKDEFAPPVDSALSEAETAIQAAKTWFYQQYASNGQPADSIPMYSLMNDNGHSHNVKAKPMWEDAQLGVDKVVEVPLESYGKISYGSPYATETQLESTITQLIIVNRDGEYVAALMHIIADSSYLEAQGYDLSCNYYKDLADDFSGKVFYTYLDGDFCNGWRYEDGQITGTVTYSGKLTVPDIEDGAPVQAAILNSACITHVVVTWFRWCTDYYHAHSGDQWTSCDPWKIVDYDSYLICDFGGGGSPGGLGSGNNNNNNDEEEDTPPTPAIYTVTVTASQGGTAEGGGSFTEGQSCNISARPDAGFVFDRWESNHGYASTEMIYSFTVFTNETLTAAFVPASTYSDCGQRNSLNQNDTITGAINALKIDAQNVEVEVGRYEIIGPNGDILPGYNTGTSTKITFPTPSPDYNYNWLFHTHIVGGTPVPSADDIFSICQGFLEQRVREDASSFAYGIVNANGTAYAVTIGDPSAFQRFIRDNDLSNPDALWYEDLNDRLVQAGTNAGATERIFVEALRNSGLSVMRSRNMTPTNARWQVVEWRNNGVATKDCN